MAIQQNDIADALIELSKLSNDELKEICNSPSDEKYDELVNKANKVKSLEAEREMLMASVRSLAEFNLARQNDYESNRSQLLNLVGESHTLKDSIQTKAKKLVELSKRTSLGSTLALLSSAVTKTEEESHTIAEEYLKNIIDHETFLSKYCATRKLLHLRRIKADRLRQETNQSWTGVQ